MSTFTQQPRTETFVFMTETILFGAELVSLDCIVAKGTPVTDVSYSLPARLISWRDQLTFRQEVASNC